MNPGAVTAVPMARKLVPSMLPSSCSVAEKVPVTCTVFSRRAKTCAAWPTETDVGTMRGTISGRAISELLLRAETLFATAGASAGGFTTATSPPSARHEGADGPPVSRKAGERRAASAVDRLCADREAIHWRGRSSGSASRAISKTCTWWFICSPKSKESQRRRRLPTPPSLE